ncbi:hypothetical protein [Rheinheimera sp.]|jgi:PBP1b-binding outer membrane lipoprotein LpoB|uniref:hypothetical protein n=1 Tax=Rheinheimera sp. TaxID=1869214 RepID=UPI0037C60468
MKTVVLTLMLLFIASCSNKAAYQNLQQNKRNECMRAPAAEYDKCMQNMAQSYEEYERQRQQALEH